MAFGSLPGVYPIGMLPEEETSDFPMYGPHGELLTPGIDPYSEQEEDPVAALRQANEDFRRLAQPEREASKYELNQAKRRIDLLEKNVQSTIERIPVTEHQQNFSWDDWNVKPGQSATPQQPMEAEARVEMNPTDFDTLYQRKRQQEVEAVRDLSRKQQQAADEFVRDARLAPYYNDALVEFQRIDKLMGNAPFEEKIQALHATVGDWISRGWSPRNPYDPKKPMGGIPVGGQNGMGPGGMPLVGDNRFRPDEQGVRGQVGFYSDDQRRADAEHDRRARIHDLEARKSSMHGGGEAKTYEEYFRVPSRKE